MAHSPVPAPGPAVEDATGRTRRAWKTLPKIKVRLLSSFLADAARHPLTPVDKLEIIEQATLMINHLYPHLPFKLDLHLIHPVAWMDENIRPFLSTISELNFHGHMIAAFSLIRDAHTVYGLPTPYRKAVAFLPFQMRYYLDERGLARYVITNVMNGFDHPDFRVGAEITLWDGFPTDGHVRALAGRLPGANEAASLTRGAIQATLSPLTFCHPPHFDDTTTATLQYIPPGSSETRAIQLLWGVATGIDAQHRFTNFSSLSPAQESASAWTNVLHPCTTAPSSYANSPARPLSAAAIALTQPSKLPEVFETQFTGGPPRPGSIDPANLVASSDKSWTARFGYIKIKRFTDGGALDVADRVVAEFQRILELMDQVAPDGLILDIRSNPGGDIAAAERMLQMLTPGKIRPARFHLANTKTILAILQKVTKLQENRTTLSRRDDVKFTDALAALGPWLDDAGNQPLPQGDRVTSGQPLTDPVEANRIGQVYHGRTVLLIDALTYSAAEVFASGFQDHAIGQVIGSDVSSGGGGANVWSHDDLLSNLAPMTDLPLKKLPKRATLSLAIRRYSRVGFFPGQWVEDVGIRADKPYTPKSAADVIAGNPGILRLACDSLIELGLFRVDVKHFAVQRNGSVKVDVATINLNSLTFLLDGHLVLENQRVSRGKGNAVTTKSFTLPAAPGNRSPAVLRVVGLTRAPGVNGMEMFLADDRRVVLRTADDESSPLPLSLAPIGSVSLLLPGRFRPS